jgi:hypothetical protein
MYVNITSELKDAEAELTSNIFESTYKTNLPTDIPVQTAEKSSIIRKHSNSSKRVKSSKRSLNIKHSKNSLVFPKESWNSSTKLSLKHSKRHSATSLYPTDR